MENEDYQLDDSDFVDYDDEDMVERETKSLDLYQAGREEIPFEYEVRLIDDF
ncbi:MAG: hypothetical protein WBA74_07070 [Cyclobacteriaceae bacterium]